jgi:hypothetical protein
MMALVNKVSIPPIPEPAGPGLIFLTRFLQREPVSTSLENATEDAQKTGR